MRKFLISLMVALGVLSLVGVTVASAQGWGGFNLSPEDIVEKFQTMFQKKSELLGISVNEYKQAWSEGKNLQEIAEEQGITQEQLRERMMQEKQTRMQERFNLLVQNGVITQEQADQKMSAFQEKFANGESGKGCGCRGGMKMDFGGW